MRFERGRNAKCGLSDLNLSVMQLTVGLPELGEFDRKELVTNESKTLSVK